MDNFFGPIYFQYPLNQDPLNQATWSAWRVGYILFEQNQCKVVRDETDLATECLSSIPSVDACVPVENLPTKLHVYDPKGVFSTTVYVLSLSSTLQLGAIHNNNVGNELVSTLKVFQYSISHKAWMPILLNHSLEEKKKTIAMLAVEIESIKEAIEPFREDWEIQYNNWKKIQEEKELKNVVNRSWLEERQALFVNLVEHQSSATLFPLGNLITSEQKQLLIARSGFIQAWLELKQSSWSPEDYSKGLIVVLSDSNYHSLPESIRHEAISLRDFLSIAAIRQCLASCKLGKQLTDNIYHFLMSALWEELQYFQSSNVLPIEMAKLFYNEQQKEPETYCSSVKMIYHLLLYSPNFLQQQRHRICVDFKNGKVLLLCDLVRNVLDSREEYYQIRSDLESIFSAYGRSDFHARLHTFGDTESLKDKSEPTILLSYDTLIFLLSNFKDFFYNPSEYPKARENLNNLLCGISPNDHVREELINLAGNSIVLKTLIESQLRKIIIAEYEISDADSVIAKLDIFTNNIEELVDISKVLLQKKLNTTKIFTFVLNKMALLFHLKDVLLMKTFFLLVKDIAQKISLSVLDPILAISDENFENILPYNIDLDGNNIKKRLSEIRQNTALSTLLRCLFEVPLEKRLNVFLTFIEIETQRAAIQNFRSFKTLFPLFGEDNREYLFSCLNMMSLEEMGNFLKENIHEYSESLSIFTRYAPSDKVIDFLRTQDEALLLSFIQISKEDQENLPLREKKLSCFYVLLADKSISISLRVRLFKEILRISERDGSISSTAPVTHGTIPSTIFKKVPKEVFQEFISFNGFRLKLRTNKSWFMQGMKEILSLKKEDKSLYLYLIDDEVDIDYEHPLSMLLAELLKNEIEVKASLSRRFDLPFDFNLDKLTMRVRIKLNEINLQLLMNALSDYWSDYRNELALSTKFSHILETINSLEEIHYLCKKMPLQQIMRSVMPLLKLFVKALLEKARLFISMHNLHIVESIFDILDSNIICDSHIDYIDLFDYSRILIDTHFISLAILVQSEAINKKLNQHPLYKAHTYHPKKVEYIRQNPYLNEVLFELLSVPYNQRQEKVVELLSAPEGNQMQNVQSFEAIASLFWKESDKLWLFNEIFKGVLEIEMFVLFTKHSPYGYHLNEYSYNFFYACNDSQKIEHFLDFVVKDKEELQKFFQEIGQTKLMCFLPSYLKKTDSKAIIFTAAVQAIEVENLVIMLEAIPKTILKEIMRNYTINVFGSRKNDPQLLGYLSSQKLLPNANTSFSQLFEWSSVFSKPTKTVVSLGTLSLKKN